MKRSVWFGLMAGGLAGVAAASEVRYVDEFDLSGSTCGLGLRTLPRQSVDGHPLTVGGKVYERGFGSHSEGAVGFRADGRVEAFDALVGVDDDAVAAKKSDRQAKMVFKVWADGRIVWTSPVLQEGMKPIPVHVDLKDVREIVLETSSTAPWLAFEACNGDWLDARFACADGAKVAPIVDPGEIAQLGVLTPPEKPEPQINGADIWGVRPGHPVIFRIATSGARPMRFTAKGLPDGVTLDATKGILGGVAPQRKGDYDIEVTAENAKGKATRTIRLAVGDTIALTPPMGWNSWNIWGEKFSGEHAKAAARALDESGLGDHGWAYVNLDDFWEMNNSPQNTDRPELRGPARDAEGRILSNPSFPDMKGLTDYIHSFGFKAGLYSSPGPTTCGGCEGSYGHELQDAARWAEWGFDYVKYDWCSYNEIVKDELGGKEWWGDRTWTMSRGESKEKPYRLMRDCLLKQDRDIVYSFCQYGMGKAWEWARNTGANCWRTWDDMKDTWPWMEKALEGRPGAANLHKYNGPGCWADPDMMLVGLQDSFGSTHPTYLTPNEQYTHVSLWCMIGSPLLIGTDLTKLDTFTKSLLVNDEVIAVSQDRLGKTARRIRHTDAESVWMRPLVGGDVAVALVNRYPFAREIKVSFDELGLAGERWVKDLWRQKCEGRHSGEYFALVPPHATKLVKMRPIDCPKCDEKRAPRTSVDLGAWRADFDATASRLTLHHAESGARISGTLSFVGPAQVTGAGVAADAGKTAAWKVADSRDGAKGRLALVDPADNVNGYITFQGDGDGVSMLVYHRTAFAFAGTLTFDAEIDYRPDAFACRLSPKKGDRVLSVKSGAAVSADDDAIFSPAADEALHVGGCALNGRRLSATMEIADPSSSQISFGIVKDYYRSRWVPYYRPLDRARAPHAPTGWLSWNTYFDQAGSKENLDEARFAAKAFKPFGMEIWNIESWQDNSPKLPVANFHNMNLETYKVQFPEGMKWLADEIRKLGFKPGLWMAPYGTGNEAFYAEHRDWFLHGADGKPIRSWNGRFTLDPTAPGALEHLTKIFDTASHEWGYEFFKIDGMSGRGPGYCAHLYERPDIRARFHDPNCPNPFEKTVAAFRKGIGDDRIFLACQGHFTGAEAAYADCSRTGADIVHPNQPVKWANICLQARCTVNQIFAHSIVFWSDPDCMLVSQGALEREQAQVEATVVALPGQQTFAGDKLAELAPDRVKLIQQALPVVDTRPAKLYPQFGHLPVWDLHIARSFGGWHVVALFNWDDDAKAVGVDWKELGELASRKFIAWEFWGAEYLGEKTGRLELEVPPRSVRLVALQPATGHPQFLTSDRHITQGGVELKGQTWNDGTLTATVNAIGGFPMTVRFAVPEGFAVQDVVADGVDVASRKESDGRILAVTLETAETKDVTLRLTF